MPQAIGNIPVKFSVGDELKLTVSPITFPSGRTTADFVSFKSTIREDPEYPRRAFLDDPLIDPVAEAWEIIASTTTSTVDSATAISMYYQADAGDGTGTNYLKGAVKRYVIDVVGIGGTGGPATIFRTNWITIVFPRTTAI